MDAPGKRSNCGKYNFFVLENVGNNPSWLRRGVTKCVLMQI